MKMTEIKTWPWPAILLMAAGYVVWRVILLTMIDVLEGAVREAFGLHGRGGGHGHG